MSLPPDAPVTQDELHAYVDEQLPADRLAAVQAHLAANADAARDVAAWRAQREALVLALADVAAEPLPAELRRAARRPAKPAPPAPRAPPAHPASPALGWRWWPTAAATALLLLGGSLGWWLRGAPPVPVPAGTVNWARYAAVAHAVYAPDERRAVEVDAAHETQLVTWLSRRMGQPMHAPKLQALGYALEGGRLLPGEQGPVAQFMYRNPAGQRLTLYVTQQPTQPSGDAPTAAFRFAREGEVNLFYWVDGAMGYALAASAGRGELARVSQAVYGQLARHSP